jgi:hypothetical protein
MRDEGEAEMVAEVELGMIVDGMVGLLVSVIDDRK